MKFIQNLSIKYKAYLLVGIGIITAILLLVITNVGLSSIKSKLDELVLSTNVERYAYLTILEEKNYLLNANASITNTKRAAEAFENAKKDVETINSTLDKIDGTSSNDGLLDKSKAARSGTNEYKNLYYKGVDLLVNIGKETEKLEHEGELATLQAQEYVLEKRKQLDDKLDATLVKKTNIATDIWKLTYVIRADEKRYMLNPDPVIFERMKKDFSTMLEHLESLKKMASDTREQEKITVFYNAAKSYETAAYKWVDLNKNLMTLVLPKMKTLGDTVVKQAMEAAEEAQTSMVEKRNAIVITLIVVAVLAIILGLLLGYIIINIILSQLGGELSYTVNAVKELSKGNFSMKLDMKAGDKSSLLYFVDDARQTLKDSTDDICAVMQDVSKGELSAQIKANMPGEFVQVKDSINQTIARLRITMFALNDVTNSIYNADFSKVIVANVEGRFKETIEKAVASQTAMRTMLEDIVQVMEYIAGGDFEHRVTANGRGEMLSLKENINKTITALGCLNEIERVISALAEGDLTQVITMEYPGVFGRVTENINHTNANLKTLMASIKESSEAIASAANEISAGNNDLSHRTEEQAASLEQTAASMEELSATVRQNTDNAKQANDLAVRASTTAKKGVAVVDDVVLTMVNINESSHQIVDIITVIDDIAFQTNILALNAAVEAARAGDQGKGFAVVAVEVRNLAQRAASAAGEIKRLISDSVDRISSGSKQVEQAGKTMEDIVDSIQKVTIVMSDIAAASIEQNSGIDQIHQAVTQMDCVTQQNAALVEEAAAAAELLESQTQHLAKEMAHFKIR
jgi:methyl-accepting chemotaxis protein